MSAIQAARTARTARPTAVLSACMDRQELGVIGILVVVDAVLRDDVTHWAAVESKQQRAQHRSPTSRRTVSDLCCPILTNCAWSTRYRTAAAPATYRWLRTRTRIAGVRSVASVRRCQTQPTDRDHSARRSVCHRPQCKRRRELLVAQHFAAEGFQSNFFTRWTYSAGRPHVGLCPIFLFLIEPFLTKKLIKPCTD